MSDDSRIYEGQKRLLLVTADVRQALLESHKWVFHETSLGNVPSIRDTELEPRDPGAIDRDLLALINETCGTRRILCVKPAASRVSGSGAGLQVRLALATCDLPARIGVDWSSAATTLALPKVFSLSPSGAFLKVIKDAASLASYDPIKPSLLKICPADSPDSDPGTWPYLVDVKNAAMVHRFSS